jgi:hypothetical protein
MVAVRSQRLMTQVDAEFSDMDRGRKWLRWRSRRLTTQVDAEFSDMDVVN